KRFPYAQAEPPSVEVEVRPELRREHLGPRCASAPVVGPPHCVCAWNHLPKVREGEFVGSSLVLAARKCLVERHPARVIERRRLGALAHERSCTTCWSAA